MEKKKISGIYSGLLREQKIEKRAAAAGELWSEGGAALQTQFDAPSKSYLKQTGLKLNEFYALQEKLFNFKKELLSSIQKKAKQVICSANDSESAIKGDDAEVSEKARLNNSILQELDILKNRLNLVERAISKMSYSTYGICEESEEAIGYDRLTVVPWARFSVAVQERRELQRREFKYSRLHAEL